MKKGFNQAADATKKAGRLAVLKTDREMLLRKEKTLKKEFGVEVFGALEKDDQDLAQTIFLKYKALVDAVHVKLKTNANEIEQLSSQEGRTEGLSC